MSSPLQSPAVRLPGSVVAVALSLFITATAADEARAETGVGSDTSGDVSDVSADVADSGVVSDTTGTDAGDTSGMDTTGGDTGDPSLDASDTTTDGGGDVETGVDAGPDTGADTGPDTGMDAGDTGIDTGDTVGTDDTGVDTGVDAGPTFSLAGLVELQFRTDASGAEVVLRRADGDGRWERSTNRAGRFEFDGLAPGDYEIEVSASGYATRGDSLELDRDRELQYTLVRDQSAAMKVEAVFPEEADETAETVEFRLEGERGSRSPSEPVAVEERRASWSVDALPVGAWTVAAEADGWESVSFDFTVREAREGGTPYAIRLYMRRPSDTPSPADTSGCGCRDRDRGGGRTPGPGGPYGPPAIVVLFGLGVIGVRFATRDDSGG